jgi:AGZA family xanthine/uracil permease-like MFS transporter
MYSIAEGIAVGVVSYVVINVVCNLVSNDKKKITPLMYVLAVLFVCKYIFL